MKVSLTFIQGVRPQTAELDGGDPVLVRLECQKGAIFPGGGFTVRLPVYEAQSHRLRRVESWNPRDYLDAVWVYRTNTSEHDVGGGIKVWSNEKVCSSSQ